MRVCHVTWFVVILLHAVTVTSIRRSYRGRLSTFPLKRTTSYRGRLSTFPFKRSTTSYSVRRSPVSPIKRKSESPMRRALAKPGKKSSTNPVRRRSAYSIRSRFPTRRPLWYPLRSLESSHIRRSGRVKRHPNRCYGKWIPSCNHTYCLVLVGKRRCFKYCKHEFKWSCEYWNDNWPLDNPVEDGKYVNSTTRSARVNVSYIKKAKKHNSEVLTIRQWL